MALAAKQAANWQCQACGIGQFDMRLSRKGNPYLVYLHTAHRYHDVENDQADLQVLCPSCHGKHDAEERQRTARGYIETMRHLQLLIAAGIVEMRGDV